MIDDITPYRPTTRTHHIITTAIALVLVIAGSIAWSAVVLTWEFRSGPAATTSCSAAPGVTARMPECPGEATP